MKREWLHHATLRAASLLAPVDQRAEWLEAWRSELFYVPRRGATRFCLGAFRDALWLRRNNLNPLPTRIHLESPLSCLAFLAALSVVCLWIAACLSGPLSMRTTHWHLRARDLPGGCLAMLMFSSVFLPAARIAMGRYPAGRNPAPWRGRLFLALKVALVQPVLLCSLLVLILAGPLLPLAPQLAVFAIWILTFRWVLMDQRRRCPVCLRLLTDPVRIGTPSETFLEWYGAESICARGHGLLHCTEVSSSYARHTQWLCLDASWSSLFPGRHL
jgi:hypothetical protein